MKSQKFAAIYIRVSTLDQAKDGYSLDAQEQALRKWCAEHRYQVYDLYADRGISGKDIDHRPDMRRLMRDAKAGCFDLVVFWALSRFTRSVQDLYSAMSQFQAWDVSMLSYTESFDTSTPMGRAMIGIVGVFAQLERELTGERVKAAMQVRASQGKRMCSQVMGYDLVGKDGMEINQKEAEYIEFLFRMYAERKNMSEVARLAREAGYRGKRGAAPDAWSIERILTNPIFAGYIIHHGQLYKGLHRAIIPAAKYNRVQRIIKAQGRITGRIREAKITYVPE